MNKRLLKKASKAGTIALILISIVTSTMAVNISSVLAAPSFPYNAAYKYGLSSVADNQDEANALVLKEWQAWKSRHITSSGANGFKRVQRDSSTGNDTVSEGLGYGMLLAVYFNEQSLFDDLFRYVKAHYNRNGLMSWKLDANGNLYPEQGSENCATDADQDIAVSLIFANKLWGSNGSINYSQEATRLISNLEKSGLEGDILKPGDVWGGYSTVNPSYFAPAWYKIFAKFTGNTKWNSVADKCYQIIDGVKNRNSGTGLVPDWCKGDGSQASGMGYNYSYDATRYPWRTVLDYLWFGDTRAKANCDLINQFFIKIGPSNIKSGYSITGSQTANDHNSSFVAPIGASSLTGYDLNFAKAMYEENIKVTDPNSSCYYGGSLKMITLLYQTGNFPNLYEDVVAATPKPTIATPTPTITTPTPEVSNPGGNVDVLGDVNADGAANSIDFGYMKKMLLGQISQFPYIYGEEAADLNRDGVFNSLDFGYMRMFLLGMKELPENF